MLALLTFRTPLRGRPHQVLVEGPDADLAEDFRQMVEGLDLPEDSPLAPRPTWAAARIAAISARCAELGVPYTEVEGLFVHELRRRGYRVLEFERLELTE